jgi:hypothetical protein
MLPTIDSDPTRRLLLQILLFSALSSPSAKSSFQQIQLNVVMDLMYAPRHQQQHDVINILYKSSFSKLLYGFCLFLFLGNTNSLDFKTQLLTGISGVTPCDAYIEHLTT